MTVQETSKIIYTIRATYPQAYQGYGKKDFDNLLLAWSGVLEDYPYEQVSAGLKVYLSSDTKGFPPSPGQVIDCIVKLTQTDEMTVDEAWGCVAKAISNGIYHAQEEWEKLPEICKKVYPSAGMLHELSQMPSEKVHSVEKSHFYRSFRTVQERERGMAKLPQSVKAMLGLKGAEGIEQAQGEAAKQD